MPDYSEIEHMKTLLLLSFFIFASCNPEIQKVGSSPDDLVKYFKLVKKDDNSLGDGLLVIAHVGDKKLLTFYIRQSSGKYAHTDISIEATERGFEVESVYSQTPSCKLNADTSQPKYFEEIIINSLPRPYNLEPLEREEAMKEKRSVGC